MKKLLLIILLLSTYALAQRYDNFASTITSASGIGNLMQVVPAAKITVCAFPGTGGIPCTNLTTTFTDQTLTTGCSTSLQVVLQGTTTCVANADSLGNFGFWVPAGFYQYCISANNISTQCFNIVVTSTGACNLQSVNANSVVFLNGTSNCTTDANFNYFTTGGGGELLIKSPGTAAFAIQIKGNTSGLMNLNVTTTGLISLFSNSSGLAYALDRDTALSPINYTRHRNASGNGVGITSTSDGFEISGAGDTSGSGSSAGFVVTNAASSLDNSPGASNSLTAGTSVGTTANNSHGGDNSLISGAYVGSGNNRGGDIVLTAGNSSGSGRGGNISLTTGTSSTGAAGQVLLNGSVFPTPTIISHNEQTTLTNTAIPNSNTTVFSKAVAFPATGCPCRVVAYWWVYASDTNSGQDWCSVFDDAGTPNGWAAEEILTTGSASNYGMWGSGSSPVTYANSSNHTFIMQCASNHTGGTVLSASPQGGAGPALTNGPVSKLELDVVTSN